MSFPFTFISGIMERQGRPSRVPMTAPSFASYTETKEVLLHKIQGLRVRRRTHTPAERKRQRRISSAPAKCCPDVSEGKKPVDGGSVRPMRETPRMSVQRKTKGSTPSLNAWRCFLYTHFRKGIIL